MFLLSTPRSPALNPHPRGGNAMQASLFNVRVPLPDRSEVFLMNTLTDAQLIVSEDVATLLDRLDGGTSLGDLEADEREAIDTLHAHGFVAPSREEERATLDRFFSDFREDTSQLRLTVLTTLQCNFACDYCFQGDHADYNAKATKMSLQTAERVVAWAETKIDTLQPKSVALTFFGGEPLLNLPVMYYLAERVWDIAQARGATLLINVITNGLLLTPEVVDRLVPYGLNGIKVTLDGDRETHNRMRPLRGGQGTFDKIIRNLGQVAGKCRISIGGNFDADTVDSYPALLDFLRSQDFADDIGRVNFKPVFRDRDAQPPTARVDHVGGRRMIPLAAVDGHGKPLGGTCMTSVGAGGSSPCDSCHFVDEQLSFLREETKKRGFRTKDGVHMGPCELHKRHAYTIGPSGELYSCPGFTGDPTLSVGDIDGRQQPWQRAVSDRFEQHAPWKACGDCSFIPVCGGGCSVAAHAELGDMSAPSCHKSSMETALVSLAQEVASGA
ncbi:MAG: radical SAM protein [Luteitalea sp.]|nr:radical SAM protein [Luteitalea sp.]